MVRAEHQLVEECRVGVRAQLIALDTAQNDLVETPDSKVNDLFLCTVPTGMGWWRCPIRVRAFTLPMLVSRRSDTVMSRSPCAGLIVRWLTMPRRWSGALSIDRKAADRLGQSAFDLFASPLRTVS